MNKMSLNMMMVLLLSYSVAGAVDIVWSGTTVADVLDQNLVISKDTTLPVGLTQISAISADVVITLDEENTVKGNPAGQSYLQLNVENGHTITFNVNHNLRFRGSSNNQDAPVIIYAYSNTSGEIVWDIQEGKHLQFGNTNTGGATELYTVALGTDMNQIFRCHDAEQIEFKARCKMGHLIPQTLDFSSSYIMDFSDVSSDKRGSIKFKDQDAIVLDSADLVDISL